LLIGILLPIIELKNWQDLQILFEQTLSKAPNSVATLVLLQGLLYHFNPPQAIINYLIQSLNVENLA
jgi:hypothetical protein